MATDSTPAADKSYYLRVLKVNTNTSVRNMREMHTIAVVLDHVALGRYRSAADVLMQRFKAVEMASTTGSWEMAQYLELLETEVATLVSKDEETRIHGRKEQDNYDNDFSNSGQHNKGKARQTNYDWS